MTDQQIIQKAIKQMDANKKTPLPQLAETHFKLPQAERDQRNLLALIYHADQNSKRDSWHGNKDELKSLALSQLDRFLNEYRQIFLTN